MNEHEGLTPEDHRILDAISAGEITGQVQITVRIGMPRAELDRLKANPQDLEAAQAELLPQLEKELADMLASNERAVLVLEFYESD